MCVVVGCWLKLRKHYKMNPTKIDRFERKNWPVMMMTAKPQRNDERRQCLLVVSFVHANKIAIEIGKQYSRFYLFFSWFFKTIWMVTSKKKRRETKIYFLCRATSTISCHVWSIRVKRLYFSKGQLKSWRAQFNSFRFPNAYGYDFNKMFCFRLNNCAAIDKSWCSQKSHKNLLTVEMEKNVWMVDIKSTKIVFSARSS